LWSKYKRLGREGDYRGDVAYQIALYQKALDLPISELPELEGLSDSEFESQEVDLDEKPEEWSDLDQRLLDEEQAEEWAEWIGELPLVRDQ
jgi:hypothetical protein